MALASVGQATGARTGEQFLEGLRQGGREIWLRGERISHPLDHPELRDAALSLARVFDLQHEHADSMLALSPSRDLDRVVNVTHLIPRTAEDLVRRRRAFELVAALSGGVMGRTPDYLNVTFACFAGRSEVWARRGHDALAANLVAYQEFMRDHDLSTTHALMNPQVDRTKPEAEQAMGQVALHKVAETEEGIVVRGARMLATLAPFADELLVYPGSDIRPQDGRYALSFAIPIATPGLRFICRDSYSKQRDVYDYPLSARFDEMDAVVIFDDVEIPRERVFLDGDTVGYSEVITDTGWRGHIMHQAFTRAYVKLCFALGLGHLIATTTGVARFDHIQEKLGQIWSMSELARSAIVAAEVGAVLDAGGVMTPDERPFLALRGEMPKWLPRVNELLQLIGGGGFMATPSRADIDGPLHDQIEQYFQSAGAGAERRIRLFRLAWDFLGSELGGRGELYERFYLSDSWRMTALAYNVADKSFPESLVEQFLRD
ncbi:MAG TPA: 4-hydroxyphenylacetate 3-hydroxylase N-terminal domain-containing protein [Solirubrobacteraceae bacterium]|jgi:4-hydroxyphenylacetate 3-monooxygenase oxygenase component